MSILTEYNEEQVLRNRFKEGREVGIAEGKEIGIIEGRTQNLLSLICRKLKKGKDCRTDCGGIGGGYCCHPSPL